jgi:hypothetical protein
MQTHYLVAFIEIFVTLYYKFQLKVIWSIFKDFIGQISYSHNLSLRYLNGRCELIFKTILMV